MFLIKKVPSIIASKLYVPVPYHDALKHHTVMFASEHNDKRSGTVNKILTGKSFNDMPNIIYERRQTQKTLRFYYID